MKCLILPFVLMCTTIPSLVIAAGQDLQDGSSGSQTTTPMNEVAGPLGTDWKSITVELPPGAVDSWQSRSGGELLYVLEGAGRLETDGKAQTALNHGTVTRLDGMSRHMVKNTSRTKRLKILVVFIQDRGEQHPLLADRSIHGVEDDGEPFVKDAHRHVHGREQRESAGTGLIF